jgi:hypothetical protein
VSAPVLELSATELHDCSRMLFYIRNNAEVIVEMAEQCVSVQVSGHVCGFLEFYANLILGNCANMY